MDNCAAITISDFKPTKIDFIYKRVEPVNSSIYE